MAAPKPLLEHNHRPPTTKQSFAGRPVSSAYTSGHTLSRARFCLPQFGFLNSSLFAVPSFPCTQSPDNIWGMFERVSAASDGGFLGAIAIADVVLDSITTAAAAVAMKILVPTP
ncbi:hypothetical protein LXL04_029949 [Taraxacum kok-saghyz]